MVQASTGPLFCKNQANAGKILKKSRRVQMVQVEHVYFHLYIDIEIKKKNYTPYLYSLLYWVQMVHVLLLYREILYIYIKRDFIPYKR